MIHVSDCSGRVKLSIRLEVVKEVTENLMKPENIILFPKWQQKLEEESIAAIQEKRFEEALEKLDKLLSYQVKKHEIYTGKLICLMELERYDDAQELCESLIEEKDEHYYEYIHIYLTLLFQTNQYEELMETVHNELETGNVPVQLEALFSQLYTMSEKMLKSEENDQFHFHLDALFDAVNQDNHIEQWRLIQKLSKLNVAPNEKIIHLLVDEHIHPLNKTAIFLWLKYAGINETIEIHKFGTLMEMKPTDAPDIKESELAIMISAEIREVEQENPSLHQVMDTLLHHYLYVLYPITPPVMDAPHIADALFHVGNEYLNIDTVSMEDEKVKKYINEIKTTELLYASILDD